MQNKKGFILLESVMLFVLTMVITVLICVVVSTYHRFTISFYSTDFEGVLREVYK